MNRKMRRMEGNDVEPTSVRGISKNAGAEGKQLKKRGDSEFRKMR